MLKFVARRLIQMVPVLLIVITITFFLIRLAPGGPFTDEKKYPPEVLASRNAYYGLNDSLLTQYARYLGNVVKGNLGPCLQYRNRTVNEVIRDTFPVSFELGCWAMIFALVTGLIFGIIAALRPNSLLDHIPMALAMTGICLPAFVLGPLLILVFGLWFGMLNASGWDTATDRILPAITLGAVYAAYIARLSRSSMLEVLPMDYIRTARAKGASELRVIAYHALKNAAIPVVSFLGPAFAGIVTGSFVVETIFQIPGMGKMFVTAAFNRDYFLLLGLIVFYAGLLVTLNLIVDILLVWLNPKIKIEA
ncbi:MAG: ABC transporter [Lentisphaerae bacterium RIFOXYA12_FULL_48_11]|nr:MAG: ABC transporter [Lentisphaerae bacterium RIFOXYA12_FULL_48_11]